MVEDLKEKYSIEEALKIKATLEKVIAIGKLQVIHPQPKWELWLVNLLGGIPQQLVTVTEELLRRFSIKQKAGLVS